MEENYGLPYTGSKSRIAHWVIDQLPRGRVLIDAFAGGCSITHRALLSQKWQTVIANDINGKYQQLFADAVRGKYRDERRMTCLSSVKSFNVTERLYTVKK